MIRWETYPYSNVHELNLDWILAQLKVLEDEVADVVELSKTWQSQVDELNSRMESIEIESARLSSIYDSFVEEVNQKFDELTAQQLEQFETLTQQFENRFDALVNQINQTLVTFNNRLNALDKKLDDTLSNLPYLIYMVSPFTGELDNIVNIINDLAGGQRVNALTSKEYDDLELTAQAYDSYELSAYDYDWNGKNLLV